MNTKKFKGFSALEDSLEEIEKRLTKRLNDHDKRFDRLEHKVNQLGSKLDIIIEHLTSINDLPEE